MNQESNPQDQAHASDIFAPRSSADTNAEIVTVSKMQVQILPYTHVSNSVETKTSGFIYFHFDRVVPELNVKIVHLMFFDSQGELLPEYVEGSQLLRLYVSRSLMPNYLALFSLWKTGTVTLRSILTKNDSPPVEEEYLFSLHCD